MNSASVAVTGSTGSTGTQDAAIAEAFAEAGWQVHPLQREDGLAATLRGAAVLAATSPIDHRRGVGGHVSPRCPARPRKRG